VKHRPLQSSSAHRATSAAALSEDPGWPLVSVVIPTYNRAAYIGDAISSVLAQDYHPVEIIVADDGSTDDTADIVARFGGAVTYLSLPHRGQPAATRNAAVAAARGEYVAFLDSDDLFLSGRLAGQVAALTEHPEAGLAYSNGYFFRDDPETPVGRVLDGLPTPSGQSLPDLLRGNFLSTPVVLIRRTCLDSVGVFDERPDLLSEDYDLWLRIAAEFPIIYVPGDVAAIRRHGQSISRDVAALRAGSLRVLAKLETTHPHLVDQYRAAFNEGYARNHGAVALAHLKQWQIRRGLSHAMRALRYSLRTPGFGVRPLLQWIRRRRVRGSAAVP
jgi:glycosyltransferase involved in cell wall biosynthesis